MLFIAVLGGLKTFLNKIISWLNSFLSRNNILKKIGVKGILLKFVPFSDKIWLFSFPRVLALRIHHSHQHTCESEVFPIPFTKQNIVFSQPIKIHIETVY